MQKSYETFIEELIPRENISFEKEGGRFAPVGDRLLVKFAEHDDAWEVCGLYTQELFKSYQNGSPFEEIIKEITDDLNRIKKADIYEKTKPRLFIRLLNADKYSADLQDAVYKTLGDIALVLYMKVTEYEGCVTSTKIRQGMLEQWGKECDEVFKEAILNTYFMSPPRIYRWEQMIFNPEYEGESFMNLGDKCELKKDAMGNCLSTTKKTNGAGAVFLPGVAEQLAYMLDSDFYMVFTSVHEVMIHNDKFVEPEDLQCVLRDTIREATPKEDYLTSRIYQCRVIAELFSACFFKLIQKVFNCQFFLFFSLDIQNDFSFHHHDQTIAMCNSVLHVVSDHQCRKVIAVYDHICNLQNFGSCFRIKSCGMFIQKQKLWFLKRCHQKSKSLSLTTREKPYFRSQSVFQTKTKNFQELFVFFALCFSDSGAEKTGFSAAFCKCKVFFDPHRGGGAHHRVLEHAADECRALVLGQVRDVGAVDDDLAGVDKERAGGGVEHRGLARAVAADNRDKVTFVQLQVQTI